VTRETIRDGLRSLEQAEPEEQWVMLCFLGGRDVEVDSAEANAAFRRAELLLATGGDPRRRLELSSRAVSSVADDLDTPTRRQQLTAGLAALQAETVDPSRAADSVGRLLADSDLAWRCLAAALLAEELGSVDDD
jgi:hypothetical protein